MNPDENACIPDRPCGVHCGRCTHAGPCRTQENHPREKTETFRAEATEREAWTVERRILPTEWHSRKAYVELVNTHDDTRFTIAEGPAGSEGSVSPRLHEAELLALSIAGRLNQYDHLVSALGDALLDQILAQARMNEAIGHVRKALDALTGADRKDTE